jgi:hypothetical protein
MTQEEYEFQKQELVKCKDPVYFYENYLMIKNADGKLVKPSPLNKHQKSYMRTEAGFPDPDKKPDKVSFSSVKCKDFTKRTMKRNGSVTRIYRIMHRQNLIKVEIRKFDCSHFKGPFNVYLKAGETMEWTCATCSTKTKV